VRLTVAAVHTVERLPTLAVTHRDTAHHAVSLSSESGNITIAFRRDINGAIRHLVD
jgi:hypothetical protein